MHDSLFVGRGQAMSDLDRVVDCFANQQRAALQRVAERAAFQQLGNQIRNVSKDAKPMHRKDVGMVESRGRLCFPLKAMKAFRIQGNEGRQTLIATSRFRTTSRAR